jgi:hypothetical protein
VTVDILHRQQSAAIQQSAGMAGENAKLEAGARTAVLVRRSDLPVPLAHPARSFFGGLPKMPSDFVWPRAGVTWDNEVEQVALTFIAQIDLSELPTSDVSAVLPARGTLYVFSSSVFEGEGNPPLPHIVSSRPGRCASPGGAAARLDGARGP